MIEPKTYWEERCEVLEGFVARLTSILIAHQPAMHRQTQELVNNWEDILSRLDKEYKDS